MNGRPLTIRKWGIGEPSGEHNAAFIYELDSNGGRGVFFGSGNRTRWGNLYGYICEISKGEFFFFFLFSFFITVIIFLSKLKDSAPGQNFSQDSYQAYVGPPCAQQYGKRG